MKNNILILILFVFLLPVIVFADDTPHVYLNDFDMCAQKGANCDKTSSVYYQINYGDCKFIGETLTLKNFTGTVRIENIEYLNIKIDSNVKFVGTNPNDVGIKHTGGVHFDLSLNNEELEFKNLKIGIETDAIIASILNGDVKFSNISDVAVYTPNAHFATNEVNFLQNDSKRMNAFIESESIYLLNNDIAINNAKYGLKGNSIELHGLKTTINNSDIAIMQTDPSEYLQLINNNLIINNSNIGIYTSSNKMNIQADTVINSKDMCIKLLGQGKISGKLNCTSNGIGIYTEGKLEYTNDYLNIDSTKAAVIGNFILNNNMFYTTGKNFYRKTDLTNISYAGKTLYYYPINKDLEVTSDEELYQNSAKSIALGTFKKITIKSNDNKEEDSIYISGSSEGYDLNILSDFEIPEGKRHKGWSLTPGGKIIEKLDDITESTSLYEILEDIPPESNVDGKGNATPYIEIKETEEIPDTIDGLMLYLGISIICIFTAETIIINMKIHNKKEC